MLLKASLFRKYYSKFSGYLGPTLEHYGEALFVVGRKEEARVAMEEAREILRVIPGEDNYLYRNYFMPKFLKICTEIITNNK